MFAQASFVKPASLPCSWATALRQELSYRNRQFASRLGLPFRESLGTPPVVCYLPAANEAEHGNFLRQSYRAILGNPDWSRRLQKPHTSAWRALPRDGQRWRELDSSTSSDALLMNIFCFPGTLKHQGLLNLLDLEVRAVPEFGVKARVPLTNGGADRTEVDMRLGNVLVEAKLTEADFQRKLTPVLETYRDFHQVFEAGELPKERDCYLGYQLIRNVLAAHASNSSFCVMLDERRPDLRETWYSVLRCVRVHYLRLRCKMLTWQELVEVLPSTLRKFLAEKYGIASMRVEDAGD